ncbi:MAG: histidine kinase [Candidatus Acidiferrales bacterium]
MHFHTEDLTHSFARTVRPYTVAFLAVLVALVIRALIHPIVDGAGSESSTFMAYTTFMVATAFSAWFLGRGPALLTIVLGLVVGDFLFSPPAFTLSMFSRRELSETTTYLIASAAFLLVGIAKQKRAAVLQQKNLEIEQANFRLREMSVHLMRAQDEERRKIARELHDSVGQYLGAINMVLAPLMERTAELSANAFASIRQAVEISRTCANEVRTISHLLYPPLLEEMGLPAAVRWYTEGFASRSGIDVQLDVADELDRFGPDIEIVLFRILQESLTNVHRHSGSKTARVALGADVREVWLEVKDQGKGMKQRNGSGVGTRGMQERIKELAGHLYVTSGDSGTTVKAVVPLNARIAPQRK